jgi:hypothetical protein
LRDRAAYFAKLALWDVQGGVYDPGAYASPAGADTTPDESAADGETDDAGSSSPSAEPAAPSDTKQSRGRWKRLAAAALILGLLLPVPALAVVGFTNTTWTITSDPTGTTPGTGFFSLGTPGSITETGPTIDLLLRAGNSANQTGDVTITGTGTTVGAGDTITGNLSNYFTPQVKGGTYTVTVTVSNQNPIANNFSSGQNPTGPDSFTTHTLTGESPTIVVTFHLSSTQFTNKSSAHTLVQFSSP